MRNSTFLYQITLKFLLLRTVLSLSRLFAIWSIFLSDSDDVILPISLLLRFGHATHRIYYIIVTVALHAQKSLSNRRSDTKCPVVVFPFFKNKKENGHRQRVF